MRCVADIMATAVRTLHRDTLIGDVEKAFSTHEISGAPIVDDAGNLAGFVSKSDISRFDSTGDDPFYARAHEIANPKVLVTEPSASIRDAAQIMLDEHVHHLVVMEQDSIVGVVSAFDYVRLAAERSQVSA